MKYTVEESLSSFTFWCGGKDRADLLTSEQLDSVENFLEENEPDGGWTDGAINDFFWFSFDTICQHLGYADQEHLEADITEEDENDAQEWAEEISIDSDKLFDVSHLAYEEYVEVDDDGEQYLDMDRASDDFMDWWNGLDFKEKVEIYREHNE